MGLEFGVMFIGSCMGDVDYLHFVELYEDSDRPSFLSFMYLQCYILIRNWIKSNFIHSSFKGKGKGHSRTGHEVPGWSRGEAMPLL